jgi:hypothetical protein
MAAFTLDFAKHGVLRRVSRGSWLSTSTEPSFEWTAAVTLGQADGGRVYGVIRDLAHQIVQVVSRSLISR